jgi:uncharacterized protein YegL
MTESWITACFLCGEQHAYWECPRMRRTNMKDATEIVVVVDKSGSMRSKQNDAIGGFNGFVEDQRKVPGEANLTLIMFDTTYNVCYTGKPIAGVEALDTNTYRPGGGTALNDALARGIIETGKRLADMPEDSRPNKVICVVITDGEENSSKEHTKEQVQEMVRHQEGKYGWAFIYLGAGVDAFAEAAQLGIQKDMAVNFADSAKGVRSAYAATSEAVSSYRTGGKEGLVDSKWKDRVKN